MSKITDKIIEILEDKEITMEELTEKGLNYENGEH